MYRYETHLHTYPVSRCSRGGVEETVAFYKGIGYDGIFITNHFVDGNLNIDRSAPYQEKIDFYFSDYEKALEAGKKEDIKVFCGVECSFGGTDFLVYGLDKEWFCAHPEYETLDMSAKLVLMKLYGALIIQAHPFREASYIDHIRLFPRHVEGVEIINASLPDSGNDAAADYARRYVLLPFAGSDNHKAGRQKKLAGVECARPIGSVDDFIAAVRGGEMKPFVLSLE